LDSEAGLAHSGVIVAKEETPAVLEGWIPIRDAQSEESFDWIPIRMPSPSYHGWPEGTVRINKIRITNAGTESVFMDAVIGVDMEREIK